MDARSAKVGARNSLTALTPTLTSVIFIGRHSRLPAYSKGKSIPQPSGTSDAEISNHLSNDLQVQLSHLLTTARGHDTVSLLVDSILSTIKDPIRPLALALVRTLQSIARPLGALRIVDNCSAARSNEFDSTLIPSFKYQKARILGSLNDNRALENFDSALLGFEAQLGPDHITTQLCRYELALQHAGRDLTTAITILASLAKTIASRRPLTKKRKWLLRKVETRLRYFQSLDNFYKPLPKSTPISGSQKRPFGTSLSETSPPAKRSRGSQETSDT